MARQINGFVGNFTSLTELTNRFPPSEYAGSSANYIVNGITQKAWCNGEEWGAFDISFFSVTGGGSGLCPDWVVAPWAVANAASWTHSLIPEFGRPPLFYRSSTGSGRIYTPDFEGVMHKTLTGEAAFYGARREENLLQDSERLADTTYWTRLAGATIAARYLPDLPAFPGTNQLGGTAFLLSSVGAANCGIEQATGLVLDAVLHSEAWCFYATAPGTAEITIYNVTGAGVGSFTKVVNYPAGHSMFAVQGTPDGTSTYKSRLYPVTAASSAPGSVYVYRPMLQSRVGSNTSPSEYVSNGGYPRTALHHGAAVNGVRYFNTTNGNSYNGSTGRITTADGAAIPESTMRGVWTFPTVQQFASSDPGSASWAKSDGGTTSYVTGPDGRPTAVRFNEGTGSTAHHLNMSLFSSSGYGGFYIPADCWFKQATGPNDRPATRLFLQGVDGALQQYVYLNLTNGTIGATQLQAGTPTPKVESITGPLGTWYRLVSEMYSGTSGSPVNMVMRIYSHTTSDGSSPTHTGDTSKGITIWMPNATGPLSISGKPRAIAVPTFANTTGAAINLPGVHLSDDVAGQLGTTDFAIACEVTPYYIPSQPNKSIVGQYSAYNYIRTDGPVLSSQAGVYGDFDTVRCGLTLRPNYQATAHFGKVALDCYPYEGTEMFKRRPSTYYAAGTMMFADDIQINNENGQKQYTVVIPGITATGTKAHATYDSTYVAVPDLVTNTTTDGTLKVQCNEDNGNAGYAEPYLGAQIASPDDRFLAPQRTAWFIRSDDYGCVINGVWATKQTQRQLDQGMKPILAYKPQRLWYGQFGTQKGVPGVAVDASNDELVGAYTMLHKRRVIYHTSPTTDALVLAAAAT